MKNTILLLFLLGLFACNNQATDSSQEVNPEPVVVKGERWSKEKAWAWYNQYDWLAGCNFNCYNLSIVL